MQENTRVNGKLIRGFCLWVLMSYALMALAIWAGKQ